MSRAMKFGPAFKKTMDESARMVFGNLPVVPYRTGNKIWKAIPKGRITDADSYYGPNILRDFRNFLPGFRTEAEEVSDLTKFRKKRKGKGPPPKGEGKRAMKAAKGKKK
jgi:hypothetical protein